MILDTELKIPVKCQPISEVLSEIICVAMAVNSIAFIYLAVSCSLLGDHMNFTSMGPVFDFTRYQQIA